MKIWLIGRTNVWKSTLFNRLIGHHRAIVTDIAWTTREIISEELKFDDLHSAIILDSPGLDDFEKEKEYILRIINESDIILFVIDGKSWMSWKEEEIKSLIYENWAKEKTIFVINKLDWKCYGWHLERIISEYYGHWFKSIVWISADKRENFDELLELIDDKIKELNLSYLPPVKIDYIPMAIVGRPNVGKSTLINKLGQWDIAKVDDKHWTTLDYLTCEIKFKWKKFKLFDTAWIRKKWKIHWLERIAYEKALSMLTFVKPVAVVLIDVSEWVVHRDLSIIGDIIKLNIPMMVAINKVDTITQEEYEKMTKLIQFHFKFAKWLPIIAISWKEWIKLPQLMDHVAQLRKEYNVKIWTSELNEALNKQWMQTPPRFPKNKVCKFYYCTQIESAPPKFKIFINKKSNANFSFVKWIDNTIRNNFWFVWVPLVIDFAEKAETEKKKTKAQKIREQEALEWEEKKKKMDEKRENREKRKIDRDRKSAEMTKRRKEKYK